MVNFYDIAYGIGVGASAPYWLIKPSARRKVLGAFSQRMGRIGARNTARPAVMIHAVSLGEINATRMLVERLEAARPDLDFIISTTTETGFARGQELYGKARNVMLIRYPLDFSGAVARVLDAARPDVVVLMELEVWPNFIRACARREIPVVLVNGRVTTKSFRNFKIVKPLAAGMFRRLSAICVQDETYAKRFIALGAPPGRVLVTGTMKFDTAEIADRVAGAKNLADAVGLRPGAERIWVCGSTGPGEEQILLTQYRGLLGKLPRLRLVLVPRKPERFDEVAQLIEAAKFKAVRRSRNDALPPADAPIPPVVLGDTMGELKKFYSLAEIVFVGRTLLDLGPRQHGSDMIEPAALGKPVIVGPFTTNFADAMAKFKAADAIIEIADGEVLSQAVSVLLSTPAEAQAMGQRAVDVIRREQGATNRHVEVILGLLSRKKDIT